MDKTPGLHTSERLCPLLDCKHAKATTRLVLTEGIHELEPLGPPSDRGLEDTGGCRQVTINRSELWSADGQCVQVDGGGDKDLLELRD